MLSLSHKTRTNTIFTKDSYNTVMSYHQCCYRDSLPLLKQSSSAQPPPKQNINLRTDGLLPLSSLAQHKSSPAEGMSASSSHQRHNVHVLFLEDQKGDHILNRLTAMLGRRIHKQGFCHVEIVVPDVSTGEYMSSSIYNGEKVTLTKCKTFANPGLTRLAA